MINDNLDILKSLTPEVVQNLRRAIELGKWPNGVKLTAEQKATCMQAVIAYESKNLPPEERTGYMPPKPKKKGNSNGQETDQDQPLKWQ